MRPLGWITGDVRVLSLIWVCLRWVFAAARRLLWPLRVGAALSLWTHRWLPSLPSTGCRCMRFSVAMAGRLSYPRTRGILVPGPGMEPTSPALAGEFLTLDQQGSPNVWGFLMGKFIFELRKIISFLKIKLTGKITYVYI